MKKIVRLTESDLAGIIRKVILERRKSGGSLILENKDKFIAKLISDFTSGKIDEKEMEMRMKFLLLEDSVKYLDEIFEDFPEVAEKVTDSYLQKIIGWVIKVVNSEPEHFFNGFDKEDLDKITYGIVIMRNVLKEIRNKFPVLNLPEDDPYGSQSSESETMYSDLVNYIKFYHDDLLFDGFEELDL